MALNPGDIMFTANFTDQFNQYSEGFSFIATTAISAGEVIRFYDHGNYFEFTVGASGMAALDRVTITETSNVFTVHTGNGTVSGLGGGGSWGTLADEAIIAASGNDVIAAIANGSASDYASALSDAQSVTPALTDTAAQATTNPSPILLDLITNAAADDNVMYASTTVEGIDNPANWVGTGTSTNPTSPNISGTTYATQDADITCFAAGTLIATPSGEVAVENLRIGDRILTLEGRDVPVKWIGRQNVMTRFAPPERLMPVRFAEGALGDGLPHADLTVTTDHAMLIDNILVHAGALVNGSTITRVPLAEMVQSYTVYHIETEAHEIILANGAPSETFIDNVTRRVFDNFAEFEMMYGDVPEMEELDYPRAMSARQVPPAIKAKLAGTAAA